MRILVSAGEDFIGLSLSQRLMAEGREHTLLDYLNSLGYQALPEHERAR
jgi:nucleoside-diphosphate-sugar epimerase